MNQTTKNQTLSERVITLIEEARQRIATAANISLVYTYYGIGRMIVQEEQQGKARAEYGKTLLKELSVNLTDRFGKGWSVENLTLMRKFYLVYGSSEISDNPITPHNERKIVNTIYEIQRPMDSGNSSHSSLPNFAVSWSHYLILMRIADPLERSFYEKAAIDGQWSFQQLRRQIGSQLYERSMKHKGELGVKELMRKAPCPEVAEEPLKAPYMLEFLGLPEKNDYSETQLEQAIIDHLAEFMLELGKGFTFVGRQVRFTFEEEHYKVDLVFYNRLTRSFFVFDLKLAKITHQDLGQMQMYVHYYDRVIKLPEENPTIGILLSSEEINDAAVQMTLPECEHNRIFARQYQTVLPSIDTFKRIICQQRLAFEQQLDTTRGRQ